MNFFGSSKSSRQASSEAIGQAPTATTTETTTETTTATTSAVGVEQSPDGSSDVEFGFSNTGSSVSLSLDLANQPHDSVGNPETGFDPSTASDQAALPQDTTDASAPTLPSEDSSDSTAPVGLPAALSKKEEKQLVKQKKKEEKQLAKEQKRLAKEEKKQEKKEKKLRKKSLSKRNSSTSVDSEGALSRSASSTMADNEADSSQPAQSDSGDGSKSPFKKRLSFFRRKSRASASSSSSSLNTAMGSLSISGDHVSSSTTDDAAPKDAPSERDANPVATTPQSMSTAISHDGTDLARSTEIVETIPEEAEEVQEAEEAEANGDGGEIEKNDEDDDYDGKETEKGSDGKGVSTAGSVVKRDVTEGDVEAEAAPKSKAVDSEARVVLVAADAKEALDLARQGEENTNRAEGGEEEKQSQGEEGIGEEGVGAGDDEKMDAREHVVTEDGEIKAIAKDDAAVSTSSTDPASLGKSLERREPDDHTPTSSAEKTGHDEEQDTPGQEKAQTAATVVGSTILKPGNQEDTEALKSNTIANENTSALALATKEPKNNRKEGEQEEEGGKDEEQEEEGGKEEGKEGEGEEQLEGEKDAPIEKEADAGKEDSGNEKAEGKKEQSSENGAEKTGLEEIDAGKQQSESAIVPTAIVVEDEDAEASTDSKTAVANGSTVSASISVETAKPASVSAGEDLPAKEEASPLKKSAPPPVKPKGASFKRPKVAIPPPSVKPKPSSPSPTKVPPPVAAKKAPLVRSATVATGSRAAFMSQLAGIMRGGPLVSPGPASPGKITPGTSKTAEDVLGVDGKKGQDVVLQPDDPSKVDESFNVVTSHGILDNSAGRSRMRMASISVPAGQRRRRPSRAGRLHGVNRPGSLLVATQEHSVTSATASQSRTVRKSSQSSSETLSVTVTTTIVSATTTTSTIADERARSPHRMLVEGRTLGESSTVDDDATSTQSRSAATKQSSIFGGPSLTAALQSKFASMNQKKTSPDSNS